MKYTTHKLPTAEIESEGETSGQEFGEAGQELSLERGESIEGLQNDQDSSLNEIEQELLAHADGVVDELDEPAGVSNHEANPSANGLDGTENGTENGSNSLAKKFKTLHESDSGIPVRSIED